MTRAVAVIGSNMGSGRLFSLMILLESFAKLDVFQEDWFESSGNIDTSRKALHKMLFGLYFFHALIQVGQLSNTLLSPFLLFFARSAATMAHWVGMSLISALDQ